MPGHLEGRQQVRHDLFPASVRAVVPLLYSQEKNENPMIGLKFFTPSNRWTWFVIDGSPLDCDGEVIAPGDDKVAADFLFFGLVQGSDSELGYFTLRELETCFIERDMYCRPKSLEEIRNSL